MNAVPVELFGGCCSGFLRTTGLLRDEGDFLCLEFQTEDRVFGAYQTGVRQVRIPLRDITAVDFKPRRFGYWSKLELRADRMEPFAAVPGASQGRVTLHIARPDRAAARRFFEGLHVSAGPGT